MNLWPSLILKGQVYNDFNLCIGQLDIEGESLLILKSNFINKLNIKGGVVKAKIKNELAHLLYDYSGTDPYI